jgi:hypothetical protein
MDSTVKFAMAFAALAVAIFIGVRVLPGLNASARLDTDQRAGLTAGNETIEGALPVGQTFVPERSDLAGIDVAFQKVPDRLTLQVREWPDGQIILLSIHDEDEGNLSCRTPHQSGQGATCRLQWERSVKLTPGTKHALLFLEWEPEANPVFWRPRNDYTAGCFVSAGREDCAAGDIYFRTYSRESAAD